MQLTRHFWLYEFTRSQKAERLGIANIPGPAEVEALRRLCVTILQPLRDMLQRPINISSGYRSRDLNTAIGGAANSQHMRGEAADIECFGYGNYALARTIDDHFRYDQLILEYHDPRQGPNSGWVHVSFRAAPTNRQEARRTYRGEDGNTVYAPLDWRGSE